MYRSRRAWTPRADSCEPVRQWDIRYINISYNIIAAPAYIQHTPRGQKKKKLEWTWGERESERKKKRPPAEYIVCVLNFFLPATCIVFRVNHANDLHGRIFGAFFLSVNFLFPPFFTAARLPNRRVTISCWFNPFFFFFCFRFRPPRWTRGWKKNDDTTKKNKKKNNRRPAN